MCNYFVVHIFQCDPFLRCIYFRIVGLDNTVKLSTKKTIKRPLKKKVQKVRTNENSASIVIYRTGNGVDEMRHYILCSTKLAALVI